MSAEFIVQCIAFAAGLAVGVVATAAVMQMEIGRLRSDVTERERT